MSLSLKTDCKDTTFYLRDKKNFAFANLIA